MLARGDLEVRLDQDPADPAQTPNSLPRARRCIRRISGTGARSAAMDKPTHTARSRPPTPARGPLRRQLLGRAGPPSAVVPDRSPTTTPNPDRTPGRAGSPGSSPSPLHHAPQTPPGRPQDGPGRPNVTIHPPRPPNSPTGPVHHICITSGTCARLPSRSLI